METKRIPTTKFKAHWLAIGILVLLTMSMWLWVLSLPKVLG